MRVNRTSDGEKIVISGTARTANGPVPAYTTSIVSSGNRRRASAIASHRPRTKIAVLRPSRVHVAAAAGDNAIPLGSALSAELPGALIAEKTSYNSAAASSSASRDERSSSSRSTTPRRRRRRREYGPFISADVRVHRLRRFDFFDARFFVTALAGPAVVARLARVSFDEDRVARLAGLWRVCRFADFMAGLAGLWRVSAIT